MAHNRAMKSVSKVGRPSSGKKTYKVRLTPKARKAAGKKCTKLGLSDFSSYVEALIRKDNPEFFEVEATKVTLSKAITLVSDPFPHE